MLYKKIPIGTLTKVPVCHSMEDSFRNGWFSKTKCQYREEIYLTKVLSSAKKVWR